MFYDIFKAVLGASTSVITLSGIGIYLFKRKVLDKQLNSRLAKLLEQVFLPCLVFSSFVKSFDPTNLHSWVPVCFVAFFMIIQGFLIGYLVNKYYLKDNNMEGMIILANGLCHTTNIQLALVFSLKDYLELLSQGYYEKYPQESQFRGQYRATNFICLFQIVNNLVRWTIAKKVIIELE